MTDQFHICRKYFHGDLPGRGRQYFPARIQGVIQKVSQNDGKIKIRDHNIFIIDLNIGKKFDIFLFGEGLVVAYERIDHQISRIDAVVRILNIFDRLLQVGDDRIIIFLLHAVLDEE